MFTLKINTMKNMVLNKLGSAYISEDSKICIKKIAKINAHKIYSHGKENNLLHC